MRKTDLDLISLDVIIVWLVTFILGFDWPMLAKVSFSPTSFLIQYFIFLNEIWYLS
jgi:hypothetical protein